MTEDSAVKHKYTVVSWWRHLVASYTGLNFLQVAELDYIQYLIWRRDAYIYMLNQTSEGVEYLNNAYRLEQTEPDRKRLREKLGKGEQDDGGRN